MPDAKFYQKNGSESKTVNLDGPLFNSEPKESIIHEYIKGFMNNQRQGTSSTLNRSRMQGGGKKPFRQKGTGRARAGSNTSPLWSGGAVIWGPTPRSFYAEMPKKLKRNALVSAFSLKAKEGSIRVVELPDLGEAKTKLVAGFLKGVGVYGDSTILLFEGKNENLTTASRNIANFTAKRAELVNPYDLITHRNILITEDGLARIKELFNQ